MTRDDFRNIPKQIKKVEAAIRREWISEKGAHHEFVEQLHDDLAMDCVAEGICEQAHDA